MIVGYNSEMTRERCAGVSEAEEAALAAIANDVRPDWVEAATPSNTLMDVDRFADKALHGRWREVSTGEVRKCFVLQCLLLDDQLTTADHKLLREIAPRIRSASRGLPSVVYWEELRQEIAKAYGEQPATRVQRLISALNLYVLLSL